MQGFLLLVSAYDPDLNDDLYDEAKKITKNFKALQDDIGNVNLRQSRRKLSKIISRNDEIIEEALLFVMGTRSELAIAYVLYLCREAVIHPIIHY